MRIIIIVNSLQQGGSERAAIRLSDSLANDGHEVFILTWNNFRDFYSLSENISRVSFGSFFDYKSVKIPILGLSSNNLGLLRSTWRYRNQILDIRPDVVICFEALVGAITAVALAFARVPLIISERVNPDPDVYSPHKIARILRPIVYKRGAICSVQTQGFSNWVINNWKVSAAVTPNHIPDAWIRCSKSFTGQERKIVSIGRIEPQKGFDVLLSAWKKLGAAKDGWRLEIVGSQNNPEYLQSLQGEGLEGVSFSNPTLQVAELLDESTIFVSSSRFEGFPNVVLEALARGIPTVASFSTDIISDWHMSGALFGYEPEDVEALVNHLHTLMTSPDTASSLVVKGLKVVKNYTWASVGINWYEAIDQARKQKGRELHEG